MLCKVYHPPVQNSYGIVTCLWLYLEAECMSFSEMFTKPKERMNCRMLIVWPRLKLYSIRI